MKRIWIDIIVAVAITATITILSVCLAAEKKINKQLKERVSEQSTVIDSLLARRMTVFDVKLNVTDKSVNKIYGRYNTGHIIMPSSKNYILEIDSVNMAKK
jgi:hypothetical protein